LEALKLQGKIDKIAREMEESYDKTMQKVSILKLTLNTLERTLIQEGGSKRVSRIKKLDPVSESLGKLSNSMLTQSKKAWQTYYKLQRKCKATGMELTRLDGVHVFCVKTEAMATDLLCYSLGHLKHKTITSN